MKTTKQLLKLLLKSVKESKNFSGMCFETNLLCVQHDITWAEYIKLHDFLILNRPFYVRFLTHQAYWWTIGHKKPRIRWLRSQIWWRLS